MYSPLYTISSFDKRLFLICSEVAEEVFNRCSEANDTTDGRIRPDSKEYTVTFSYEFLEDFRDKKEDFCTRIFNTLTKGYNIIIIPIFFINIISYIGPVNIIPYIGPVNIIPYIGPVNIIPYIGPLIK